MVSTEWRLGQRRSRRDHDPRDAALVIDKPAGMTSAAVVQAVRTCLHLAHVGHTGTLDPLATGVLPLCVGRATRLVDRLTAIDKTYEVTIELGASTTTFDADGEVTARCTPTTPPDLRTVEAVAAQFVGALEQTVPVYSALKQHGRRLHQLAREGVAVVPPRRAITVHALTLRAYAWPHLALTVHCTKGTYIRSLAHDLGQALGVGGHVTALRRTQVGRFTQAQAQSLAEIEAGAPVRWIPLEALLDAPKIVVPEADLRAIADGVNLSPLAWGLDASWLGQDVQLMTEAGKLAAVCHVEATRLRYVCVFLRREAGIKLPEVP